MKVTVYVNWNERKVFSEDGYKEEINRRAEDFCADDDNFEEQLDRNYTSLELYNLKDNQKKELRKAFFDYAWCEEGWAVSVGIVKNLLLKFKISS